MDDCRLEMSIQSLENILIKYSNLMFDVYKNKFAEILAGKDGDFNNSFFKDDSIEQVIGFLKRGNKVAVENYFSHSPKFDFHYINKKQLFLILKKIEIFLLKIQVMICQNMHQ
ncbi:hypothetical protein [Campylobacter sp. CCUG 57310]|uniref:hypothetical protein n=1 Tax=Campylobacter sp. CCUG 57310 TaxID=2517362 RepID=UPI001C20C2B7|nr:hypothetical protein [Campylobacter sp. CCUG 57310]